MALPPSFPPSCCLNQGTCSSGPVPACRDETARSAAIYRHRDLLQVYECMPRRHRRATSAEAAFTFNQSANSFLLTSYLSIEQYCDAGLAALMPEASHTHRCRHSRHRLRPPLAALPPGWQPLTPATAGGCARHPKTCTPCGSPIGTAPACAPAAAVRRQAGGWWMDGWGGQEQGLASSAPV